MKKLIISLAGLALLTSCESVAKLCPALKINVAPQPADVEETAANVYDTAQTVARATLHNQFVDRTICRKS